MKHIVRWSATSVVCIAVLFAASAGGDVAVAGTPASLTSAVDSFAARHPGYPGVAVAVRSSRSSWTGAAGHASFGATAPLDPAATFRIASVTKTFVAAAILRLVESGRIGLDDPVAAHLRPATVSLLRAHGYEVDAMRVRHLLTHTSGLYDYAEDPAYQTFVLGHGHHHWTRGAQLRFAMTHGRPVAAPGRTFHYADTGYILLGEMLERETHLSLAAALRSLVGFDRLGLRSTYLETFEPKPAHALGRAHQYYDRIDTTAFDPSFDLYGGGGLVSTVDDLARFYDALFDGRVFEHDSTLRTMLGKPNARRVTDFGMGIFSSRFAGEDCWAHSGFWGTTVVHCPRTGATIAVAVNQAKDFDLPSQALVARLLRIVRAHG
jgi:D-alanyl-D-alanine carboxypeptidase